ncbi:MAG: signal peptidase II [Kiritimatiellaeota bacterium]|nr:signal peptidase II [Kiritimatiellota bacterium]
MPDCSAELGPADPPKPPPPQSPLLKGGGDETAGGLCSPFRIPWLWALAVIAADQLTKWLALAWLKPLGRIPVILGFFNLGYVENPGAAWGILAGWQVFLIAFSVAVLAFFFWKRRQLFGGIRGGGLIFATLLGGVLGNLIDRIRLGYVIDFLDFYLGHSHFPTFNIADSAICCSVFAFLLMQWLGERKKNIRLKSTHSGILQTKDNQVPSSPE